MDRESLRQFERVYGFDIEKHTPIGAGSGNDNYLLYTNKGDYTASIIQEQSFDEVIIMTKLLRWLEHNDYETTKLISPISEAGDVILVDGRPCFLRTYIRGQVLEALNEQQLMQLGKTIGELHKLPCPSFLPNRIYYDDPKFLKSLQLGHDRRFETLAWERYQSLYSRLDIELPFGLIHADAFLDNIVCQENGELILIDFEIARKCPFILDIAMALIGSCVDDTRVCPGKSRQLILGYGTVRRLTEIEQTALKSATEYAAIMTAIWRYWRHRQEGLSSPPGKNYQTMMEIAVSARELPDGIL